MEFEGVVVQLLPPVRGVSAKGEWTKQEVILEQTGEFGRKVCVGFWGDKAQDAAVLVEGDKVRVAANVESREYNGKWYTDVRAWKLERAGGGVAVPAAPASGGTEYDWGTPVPKVTDAPPEPAASSEEFDDLPF